MTDHICETKTRPTVFRCHMCGELEDACVICGATIHKCIEAVSEEPVASLDDIVLPEAPERRKRDRSKSYRPIPGYPEYTMNSQGSIRSVAKQHYVFFVRLTTDGHALVLIYKDGVKHFKTVQELYLQTFGKERAADEGM